MPPPLPLTSVAPAQGARHAGLGIWIDVPRPQVSINGRDLWDARKYVIHVKSFALSADLGRLSLAEFALTDRPGQQGQSPL